VNLIFSNAQYETIPFWYREEMDHVSVTDCPEPNPILWDLPRRYQMWEYFSYKLQLGLPIWFCLLQAYIHSWGTLFSLTMKHDLPCKFLDVHILIVSITTSLNKSKNKQGENLHPKVSIFFSQYFGRVAFGEVIFSPFCRDNTEFFCLQNRTTQRISPFSLIRVEGGHVI